MPRTVAFCTLGCKVNQYDSQAMLERFEQAGYTGVPFGDLADVYVVNTCTVTGTGDQKSRQMIRRAARRNPSASIVVTGCMAQRTAQSLALPGVRLILGTQRRGEIVALLERALTQSAPLIAVEPLADAPFETLTVRGSEGRTRATLKIQEGCENHCTYCIIPSVRGPIRSRPLMEIQAEAERLAAAGYPEMVVTGIHLSSYGRDFADGTRLLDALQTISDASGGVRIRIGSLEPSIITERFVDALSKIDGICPQFMLALQSGSDAVLARMGRRYTTPMYRHAADLIRSVFPNAALTTDIMAGFPGETEAEFAQTKAFLPQIGFARIHVFPYSEREGTKAASMTGSVAKEIREARAAELLALGRTMERAYMETWIGATCAVLFEQSVANGAIGYTPQYIRVIANGQPGTVQKVRIEGFDARDPHALTGTVS